MLSPSYSGVFVGRQREMGELKAALEDALSDRGRLVMLVGEPGIGKTRTAEELAALAQQQGARVLWARCYEEQGPPPYWPWVQAIRSYVHDCDAEMLRSEMGAGAADIAEVVSDVRERLPDLKPPPALVPEQARFRLFDSITSFLKSAGRRQPLVLILEDLHWADRPSLLLLEFLARELANGRLLVIGTYRDVEVSRRHPLSQTLGELTRERLFQRILLRGLGQEDVGRFIELVSGLAPPRGLVEAVYRQTEGNPLFVTEVVRFLVQEGGLAAGQTPVGARHPSAEGSPLQWESWTVRIPEGVREVIGRRLDRLSERCNQTLTIASVIGREFTMEQLKPLIEDMTEDRLLEVLEEALAARVIEEVARAVGRYQFTHTLIQETLLEELTLTRRVRLHARIAEALEELYGPDADAHAAELAQHFAEAQTVLGIDKLVRYSLLAGESAVAAYAWEEAQAHFERGLTAKGVSLTGTDPATEAEAAALLFGLGRAQAATLPRYQFREYLANLRRAFEYYVEASDVPRAVTVAEYPVRAAFGVDMGRAGIMSRALALIPSDSQQAGRLLSTYGSILYQETGDYQGAQEAFGRALVIVQREKDANLQMRTLANVTDMHFQHLRFREAVENGLRAIELCDLVDLPRAEVVARFWTAHALFLMGHREEARRHAAAMLPIAERLRDRTWLGNALWINGTLSRLEGDWHDARTFLERVVAVAPQDPRLLCSRVVLDYEAGDFSQGEVHTNHLLEVTRRSAMGAEFA